MFSAFARVSIVTLMLALTVGCGSSGEAGPAAGSEDLSASPAPTAGSDLTSNQEDNVLGLIDDHCSDADCEGDLDFVTKSMKCDFKKQQCVLKLTVTTKTLKKNKKFARQCVLSPITRVEDMLQSFPNGASDLTSKFIDQIEKCDLEAAKGVPTSDP
jgi:hypothetical protein